MGTHAGERPHVCWRHELAMFRLLVAGQTQTERHAELLRAIEACPRCDS